MTFLEAVNAVQRNLRETVTATTSLTDYSTLLARFVNQAKRIVEDAYDWQELKTELSVTTSAGTDAYSLAGSGQRMRILRDEQDKPYIYNTTAQYQICHIVASERIRRIQGVANVTQASPEWLAFEGVDSSGDMKVVFYPTPNATETIKVYAIVPQADLDVTGDTDDATQIKVPGDLVVQLAWALAIAERGEDGSAFTTTEQYALYETMFNDFVSFRQNMEGFQREANVL